MPNSAPEGGFICEVVKGKGSEEIHTGAPAW